MRKVTLKDVCWVALINIGVLALAVYAWISYNHRQKIFNSEEPIQNYSVLKINCGGRRMSSSIVIEYNGKQYHVGVARNKCKPFEPQKIKFFYDREKDEVYEESGLVKRHVVFYFIFYLCSCIWLFVTIWKRNKDKRIIINAHMKSKQQIFFLTKSDIIKMMSKVEKRIPIEYVLMGTFTSEVVRRENSISKFTELGHTKYANWISMDNRYMVQPLNSKVNNRIVKQKDGSFHYIIELSSNPNGVELSTGGIYQKAEKVLIAGRIAAFADSSEEAKAIYKEIIKAMNECSIKKKNVFVSPEALSLLNDGWRLTYNYNAPCDKDFK
ncbi:hypothetical protein [uncultured Bacteroides sp.]|jgi:hypothetical protein|uniref:hypothetical protein n=1 Tax=uncultured Bacteroides sp. TaxID=162156 RepID=UPI0025D68ED9|nr:hypothetical protein [uncultured Bacteroides sp.]